MEPKQDKTSAQKTITQPPTQQQSMLKPQTTQPPPTLTSQTQRIKSSAFPSTKTIIQQSISHKIISHSYAVTNNITMRTGVKQSDVIEVRHLQLEWFPLQYGDYFYEKLLAGKYRCLITETDVVIEWPILKQILQQKYEVEEKIYRDAMQKKIPRNQLFFTPSKYFQNQGIKYQHLYKQEQQDMTKAFAHLKTVPPKNIQETNPKPFTNLLKIKLIIAVMVFDVTMSSGYLSGVWWSQKLFNMQSSIYINTIGVSHQFRKTGLAKKMLQWLIDRMKKQGIFKLLYLHVIEYNQAAISLYKRFGFKQLDVLEDYYHIDGKGYKGILLGLFLNGGEKRIGWKQWFGSFWK